MGLVITIYNNYYINFVIKENSKKKNLFIKILNFREE